MIFPADDIGPHEDLWSFFEFSEDQETYTIGSRSFLKGHENVQAKEIRGMPARVRTWVGGGFYPDTSIALGRLFFAFEKAGMADQSPVFLGNDGDAHVTAPFCEQGPKRYEFPKKELPSGLRVAFSAVSQAMKHEAHTALRQWAHFPDACPLKNSHGIVLNARAAPSPQP